MKQIIFTNLIKFIRSFKIQKLLNRQKRGDHPPKRKANVKLSNTKENHVKKRRDRPPKAKSALNIDKLIKTTNFYML